ncbi:MAG TPA: YraN family protein [Kineosporiaceae bacterium]|nr:YraN family protein [Kineosporiaceae bacterium]
MRVKDVLGAYGEKLAAEHLLAEGMTVLYRRWRCRFGELDIVALDGRCLVVVEVKTRRSTGTGAPLEAVTPAKLQRLRRLAAVWLDAQETAYPDVRIDVIGVLVPRRGAPVLDHLRGVS